MSDLKAHLVKLIKFNGPIPISTFMTEALTNPKFGYYLNKTPFGNDGDFITSPEISQLFGELIGLWFADIWLKMDCPQKVHLIELGPGNGTLLSDLTRALSILPSFKNNIELHLVEASPKLIKIQKYALSKFTGKITWHETVSEALDASKGINAATFVLANEFFDALPIRQFQKCDLGWHERMVNLDPKGGEDFIYMLSPFPIQNFKIPKQLEEAAIHSIIEVSPMADNLTIIISEHLKKNSGAALFIDYGYNEYLTGDTLQAVKKHKYVDLLRHPGFADLSSHVNFRKISDIAKKIGLQVHETTSQQKFLTDLGINDRVNKLKTKATPEQIENLLSGVNRLISPKEMGTLFKVLGVTSDPSVEVIGF
ncbi:MAG: SAM-dependent methyltransferase [Emcibacteraceae bacterium]|nr:SAM-dependent methyltransferase [Emcibacteraceae bacterium]